LLKEKFISSFNHVLLEQPPILSISYAKGIKDVVQVILVIELEARVEQSFFYKKNFGTTKYKYESE
jgi:hypothetical protein